jgi:hypothetical protein
MSSVSRNIVMLVSVCGGDTDDTPLQAGGAIRPGVLIYQR